MENGREVVEAGRSTALEIPQRRENLTSKGRLVFKDRMDLSGRVLVRKTAKAFTGNVKRRTR